MATRRAKLTASKALQTAHKQKEKERLISEVYMRPAIWNRHIEEHRDKYVVDTLWAEIGRNIECPVLECKKRWKNLRDHFANLYHEAKRKVCGNELTEEDIEQVKWVSFKHLIFLKDVITRRETFDNTADCPDDNTSTSVLDTETPQEMLSQMQARLSQTCSLQLNNNSGYNYELKLVSASPEELITPDTPVLQPSASAPESPAIDLASNINGTSNQPDVTRNWRQDMNRKRANQPSSLQDEILTQLKQVTREINNFTEEDKEAQFGKFVVSLIKQIPEKKRRKQMELAIVTMLYNAISE